LRSPERNRREKAGKKSCLAPPGPLASLARALHASASILSLLTGLHLPAAMRPNFLIILADDCTYNALPIYGGRKLTLQLACFDMPSRPAHNCSQCLLPVGFWF
jgi:hypothetical protein